MTYRFRTTLIAATVALAAPLAFAAGYPEKKTVNYIIPFGPGGESDVSARFQEPVFKKITGQGLAIQYKAGAGGAAGWSQLNSMAGDGYTVMGTNLPHIVLQPLEKKTSATRPTRSPRCSGSTTRLMPCWSQATARSRR